MKRILVAVDGSSPSQRAVDIAADVATKYGFELLLVNVMQEQAVMDPALRDFARSEGLESSPFEVFRPLAPRRCRTRPAEESILALVDASVAA
jgi:nucleotide-binding universal stress UspA family protein